MFGRVPKKSDNTKCHEILCFRNASLDDLKRAYRKAAIKNHPVSRVVFLKSVRTTLAVSLDEIPPNALRRKCDRNWRGGFSLGVDLGMSHTGLALSKGFSVRPLTVLELRGQKLELRLIDIAEKQEVDEFIVGLPKSSDGKETPQSNKVRSVAGRLAVRAAERRILMLKWVCDYFWSFMFSFIRDCQAQMYRYDCVLAVFQPCLVSEFHLKFRVVN
ncbi:unnamed protein product [Ilex paraguariensis]|uniref:YqgF/RNase H-like domain-containing protein n=1 Tax=Ilex paraguariensis TaxID=185542 RepID=A0ABC8RGE3_9AQUA